MPVRMSFWEKVVWNNLNMAPGIVADYFTAMGFRVAESALNLGIFEILSLNNDEGGLTSEQVATKINAGVKGTRLLLEALESLEYVVKDRDKDRYRNSKLTSKWLVKNSPCSIHSGIKLYKRLLFERLESLEDTIVNDRPRESIWEWVDKIPNGWNLFQDGMMAGAKMSADEIASLLKFPIPPTPHKLLDIGGGHGIYTIKVCQKNLHLRGTIFDWAKSLGIGKRIVATSRLEDRINFIEGDFEKDELPSGYDTVFLFNIIHGYLDEFNIKLFKRIEKSLNSRGRIVILDLVTDHPRGNLNQVISKLMGLVLFNDLGGQTHSFESISRALKSAGFGKIKKRKLLRSPFTLILASKN